MLNIYRKNTLKVTSMFNDLIEINVSELAYKQMNSIIKNSSEEVGWLLVVDRVDNEFNIEECIILEQEVNGVTCELSQQALNDLAMELLTTGQDELYSRIGGWCHSHVNMPILPSAQDNEQMKYFSENNNWFIRGIGNKKGELKFDLFDYETGMIYEDVKWSLKREESIQKRIDLLRRELNALENMEDKEVDDAIKEELKKKVSKKVVSYNSNYGCKAYTKPKNVVSTNKTNESIYNLFDYNELLELYESGTNKFTETMLSYGFEEEEINSVYQDIKYDYELYYGAYGNDYGDLYLK